MLKSTFHITGESYFTIEKSATLILRMLTISFVFIIFSFIPLMLFYPCYPPMITSWMYRCDQVYTLDLEDYLNILLIGSLNLTLFLQILLECLVHGGFMAFACCVCLLEYTILIKA